MDKIIDVSEATFEYEVVDRSSEIAVVVDFWAPWCGPCRTLSPILERLAHDPTFNFVLAKVNVDENPNLSMQYRVQGIPAVKGFLDGEIVGEFVGVQPEPRIRQFLERLIPDEVQIAVNEAKSLLATHHWAEAEAIFEALLEEYPQRVDIQLGLARTALAQGDGCIALDYLKMIRDGKELSAAQTLIPLAKFLCAAATSPDSLVETETEPAPIEAQYRQAGRLLSRGNFEAALDGLVDVLRQDKRYRKGEPRDVMLGVFELLGSDNTLTQQYRQELASVLF